jgi:arylsulfatase A-like enzyme
MKWMKTMALAGAALVLAGVAGAQDVKVDFDKAASFAGIKTFSLRIGTTWGNPLGEKRVTDEITQGLTEKGWTLAEEGKADAQVVLHGATETKRSLNTFYSGMGGYRYRGFGGSLYHLNAEEEPENEDYFKDPALIKRFNTRGVLHTWANPDGTQRIESTGPLTKKRMETIDEEVTKASLDYLDKANKADKPFFLWWNSTRMHV